MHVGNLRTGLFAWLTARHAGGQFILRLEDTDKNREVEGSADHILECLNMLGLERDEGIDVGGPHAPYIQSERLDIYKQWAQKLIDAGRAYADPYTAEEVQKFREQAQAEKKPFLYRNHRPENPPSWDGSMPLRFKSEPKEYSWHDEVMGDLRTGLEVIDDFILIKSDGYPTYNFAHIVDDAEMGITHVIRGQEFLSSMPNYLNLYDALDIELPKFAHLPHILNEQGNKKLGKRDGAKDVLEYVRDGFLPETLLGFIATMGWNDGTEQEVYSRDELITKFTLDRVQHSGAHFDEKRLLWMNGQFIRSKPLDELYKFVSSGTENEERRMKNFWPDSAHAADESYKMQVLGLAQDRLKTLADLQTMGYFFAEPTPDWSMVDGNKQLAKLDRDRQRELLLATKTALESADFSPEALQPLLNELLEQTGEKPGTLFSLIRFAITWAPFSPGLPETMAILGRNATLGRLQKAIDTSNS
jgi:glutamyl-tRNA synthetase